MMGLNVTFVPATNENEVIPNIQVTNTPEEYFLSNLSSDMLRRPNFNVDNFQASGHVKTFLNNLHRVVKNAGVDIGTEESKTDTLMSHILLRVIDFGDWPLAVRVKETYKLPVGNKTVSAKPDFVVDKGEIAMIVIGDKHLKNITAPEFGEAQMMVEILACGFENIRIARAVIDRQTIFAVRVVSSYVTFYKCEISAEYLQALKRGLPRRKKVKVLRWPVGIDPLTGLDLAEPGGRRAVLTALVKIRQFILQSSNTTTASGSSTTTASQDQAGSSFTTASAEQSITTASQDQQAEPISKSEGKKPVK